MKLVVGLGNPGPRYARTRHNVGFMTADRLRADRSFPELRDKFSGVFTKGSIGGEDVVVLEPMTFMNESGRSVQAAVAFFHVDAKSELLVLHDELDIPFGDVRMKVGGGHAGHNGLRSIIAAIGPDFGRVRIGIGRPPAGFRGEVADFVLQGFDADESIALDELIARASDATSRWVKDGAKAAMNAVNTREKRK
ncbi:MAG: aminoacyl-tRNA hydrolase [Polyangiales bacterium]